MSQPATSFEPSTPVPAAETAARPAAGPILVVVDGSAAEPATAVAARIEHLLEGGLSGVTATVLIADRRERELRLTAAAEAPPWAPAPPLSFGSISAGGIPGVESALPALLRRADELSATAIALVAAEEHDESVNWVRLLLEPVLEGYDYVCPAYRRGKLDGTLVSGLAYPFTRALYGQRVRQPLGGELALSLRAARQLLSDEDWDRDPRAAGGDAWLTAKLLSGDYKVAQAWLGRRVHRHADHDDLSQILARILGLIFRETERNAALWQRVSGSRPVQSFGQAQPVEDEGPKPNAERLVGSFRQGLRDLHPIWGTVLAPTTLLAMRRASLAAPEAFRLDDVLWVRAVYDFAVAHFASSMERGLVLRSMTPLYLGWVASFSNEVQTLDAEAAEARVEQLCQAFEREKPYLISRWRWPDRFQP